ncbi:ATP-dependent RNA helicase TDRD12 [Asbolus verrucosus]|uniref:Probable ATP-dependent RNA helicase spindle-E n=1 Tax=Asbolus verrucosus TaxID=1661398 RepID=A0A482W4L7_ASBVE|nr:ATP-dependent RNA helicase TDRD12 [Asbolus verrucosus]
MASSQEPSTISEEAGQASSPKSESQIDENDPENDDQIFKPESDSTLLIKPFCECQNCHHWSNSVDWCTTVDLEFDDHHNKVHREKKMQPLLRSEKYPGRAPKILTFSCKNLSQIEKQMIVKTLIHGESIPQPVKLFSDTYFDEDIQMILQDLNYKYSLPIQSFVWPAIFRQLNVFMISGRKTGKTMAYLPAICTFGFQKNQKYQELAKYKGPLIVIVCSNSKQCEEIFDLIKKFYSKIHLKPKVSIVTYPISNANNMDILITIPDSLLHCIKSRIFNFKRLCHLVFEDASTLLKNNEENLYKILNVVNEMLEHRMNNAKVQLIVASEKWTNGVKKLLKSIYMTPIVCIGNYLEAALYANIQFDVKFLKSINKKIYVEELLRNKYYIYKTLIICNKSEILEVNKWLVRNGIKTIALSENSDKEDIEEGEREWSRAIGGEYEVLLCTELIFETCLTINDAVWLIHYSFPSSWTRFTRSFSAMSSNYKSPLEADNTKQEKVQCRSFLIIDETCEEKMPKISYLLNRLSKDFPATYKRYIDNCKIESEKAKILAKKDLCKTLKLFGKCPNPSCNERHMVSEDLDVSHDLPENGKIVFKILDLKDVTQYVVQLIEHIDLNGSLRKINDFDLKQPLIYDPNTEKKRARDVEVGRFYAHCDYTVEGEIFMLCHVLNVGNDTFVEVKLTTGVTLKALRKNLYEPPPSLEIVEVYLCNLIPPHKDEYFSGRSYFTTRASLESLEYENLVLRGDIQLQLDKTFWLNNVVQVVKIAHSEVDKFNFTKHLINLQVVEVCNTQISALHKLCNNCGITLPQYAKPTAKKPVKAKEIEPQRSFLDENPNEVILSSAVTPEEFYVRLSKYQCLLENLEKDIQNAVKNEILDKNVNVSIGKYYLARDSKGELYSRVLVLNTQDDKALCFYVDYGDEAVVHIPDLKYLPSKFITRLPFQAILCRLHGLSPAFGEWEDEATDVLYKYMLEPDSDIYRSLFVQVRDTEDCDTMRTKLKYSVLLKDGFGTKNVLLNQLIIDCGFATSVFGKIDDFELPNREPELDSLDSDSDSNDESESEEILRMLVQITSESTSKDESNSLVPEVYWSQTDEMVKLKVKLIGVTVANLDGKTYKLKFILHKTAEMGRHSAKGQEVEVVLKKVEPMEWLQLTGTNKRMRNIHYEILDIEKKEPKRKFLQLDIPDDESDEDDNVMFHQISDLDSEFDDEEPSSSSD